MATKLLFVCLGNICRSPAAENIMNHLVQEAGIPAGEIVCDSAGTNSYHIGDSPDRRMQAAAKEKGILMVGKARGFTAADFEKFDLILAMDKENYKGILSYAKTEKHRSKTALIMNFAHPKANEEVPDPYYDGRFELVYQMLDEACEAFLTQRIAAE